MAGSSDCAVTGTTSPTAPAASSSSATISSGEKMSQITTFPATRSGVIPDRQ